MESETNAAPLWVLLGAKHGDNQQLLAIAKALDVPYRAIPLRFNRAARQAPLVLGASRLSWASELPLEPPWPRAVLAAGRKSVPAARWIRRRSGGRTQLIHVNRPWAPLSWFDLIVTTPQYALPERPNVMANLMPFTPSPSERPPAVALPGNAAALPRPWTVVLVGGKSRPFVLDDTAAADLATMVNARVRASGGSAWVLDSPRTPAAAMDLIEHALDVPSRVSRWRDGEKLYGTLRGLADRFIVTADSASMLTEALLTGKPVTLFDLPTRPDLKSRIATGWRTAAERAPSSMVAWGFRTAVELGLLSSVRDLSRLHSALADVGLFDGTGRAPEWAERERLATLARIKSLIEAP